MIRNGRVSKKISVTFPFPHPRPPLPQKRAMETFERVGERWNEKQYIKEQGAERQSASEKIRNGNEEVTIHHAHTDTKRLAVYIFLANAIVMNGYDFHCNCTQQKKRNLQRRMRKQPASQRVHCAISNAMANGKAVCGMIEANHPYWMCKQKCTSEDGK